MGTQGLTATDRQQKHHEILDAYELLFRSIDQVEQLASRVLQGDAPEVAKTAREDYGNITLGQFLEAFPLQLRELANRIDVARSDLTQALF